MISEYDKQIDKELTDNNNNILLYKLDIYGYYELYKKAYNSVFITTPRKGRQVIVDILKKLNPDIAIKGMTIPNIIEHIDEKVNEENKLYIFMNHFEQLSKREAEYYIELNQNPDVIIIANVEYDKEIKVKDFMNEFIVINQFEFNENRSQSVNVTYTLLLLLSILVFLAFVRTQLSVVGFLVSALWFTLLIFRTFNYITR